MRHNAASRARDVHPCTWVSVGFTARARLTCRLPPLLCAGHSCATTQSQLLRFDASGSAAAGEGEFKKFKIIPNYNVMKQFSSTDYIQSADPGDLLRLLAYYGPCEDVDTYAGLVDAYSNGNNTNLQDLWTRNAAILSGKKPGPRPLTLAQFQACNKELLDAIDKVLELSLKETSSPMRAQAWRLIAMSFERRRAEWLVRGKPSSSTGEMTFYTSNQRNIDDMLKQIMLRKSS